MSSITSTDTNPVATGPTSLPPQGNPNQLPSSTNYFYGFLIAFLAFLISFGGLHIMARRRRSRLMRDFQLYGLDGGVKIPATEPLMWEPSYGATQLPLWDRIMPLSSTLVQRDVLEEKATVAIPPRNSLAAFARIPPSKSRRTEPHIVKVTERMNIVVIISMPEAPRAPRAPEEDEIPPVYEIGTLQVPWTDKDIPQTP